MEARVMTEVTSLLMEIQQAIGCHYLSDLHTDCHRLNAQMKNLLMQIPLDRYTVLGWNEAASYITDEKCCFALPEEARDRIIAGR